MIISASRRTDIPCYYSDWFMNRIKAGYVLSRNPMNHSQVKKITLRPDVVDCIVFWTKDASNIMDKLKYLDNMGYKYCFQYTVTSYETDIEKCLNKERIVKNFIELGDVIGNERLVWRYDPIFINHKYTIDFHEEYFEKLCKKFYGYSNTIVISFLDIYSKIKKCGLMEPPETLVYKIAQKFNQIGNKYDFRIQTCSERFDLTKYGILNEGCINKLLIEKTCGYSIKSTKDSGQRQECKCIKSIDVGAYNTCPNGCIYCYANNNNSLAISNYKNHNDKSELLIGNLSSTDKIFEKEYSSNGPVLY